MMIQAIRTPGYRAFGLRIESDIALPELTVREAADSGGAEDEAAVAVRLAELAGQWERASDSASPWAVDGGRILFRVPEVAIFGVENGDTILISPDAGADEDRIRLYVLGTCMGAILLQRRMLPLHGSAVAIGGRAYAVVGDSGAGKSTLSAALMSRGFRLLSDDVIALRLAGEGPPLVMSAYPQQKLWQDAIERLGLKGTELRPLFDREAKYAVPLQGGYHAGPLPLGGVFELSAAPSAAAPVLQPVSGMERYHLLYRHTFRRSLVDRLGLMEWHFCSLAGFVSRISVGRLVRPAAGFSAPQLAERLADSILKESIEGIEGGMKR